MIPVYQTDHGSTTGNCWPATIASILEIPQSRRGDIPNFCELFKDDWRDKTNEWLIKNFGCYFMSFLPRTIEGLACDPPGWHGISGPGPRGVHHSCVGYYGKIVHDPFSRDAKGEGLTIEYFDVFIPCDPALSILDWKKRADFKFYRRAMRAHQRNVAIQE